MAFPEHTRVIYGKNPLVQVICQLRFPAILHIETAPPAEFQKHLRDDYPKYTETRETAFQLALAEGDVAQVPLPPPSSSPGRISHSFASDDEKWKVTLARGSVSLTADAYTRWEEFRERLQKVFDALVAEYKVPKFSRVGLRYQDLVRRSALGLGDVAWNELLRASLVGELADEAIGADVAGIAKEVLVKLSDFRGQVRIRHGYATHVPTNEQSYLLDSDFFLEEPTDAARTFEVLDGFRTRSGRLFRWAISDRLHNAMDPKPA